ncbi:zinc ribbon domain-containing protein [Halorussus litoreus]|uniref:zinc ribbon domain-containing protein n=1 Tax=Halorussus litoreus TaxID=1710536 RepID=UPI000E2327C2|nr:zinc ribbon domain-containing protein [Halorussus litoreus]
MGQSTSQKRPWLAALLGVVATGLGHLYLRRWRRAFGWLVVLFGAASLFVEPAALEEIATGAAVDPVALAPVLAVAVLSTVDAYVLAHAQNAVARLNRDSDGDLTHCPNCGNELDPDIEFCHWCTADVSDLNETPRTDGE